MLLEKEEPRVGYSTEGEHQDGQLLTYTTNKFST